MNDQMISLGAAAEMLEITPLTVVAECAQHGLPCLDGWLDPHCVDILRSAGVGHASRGESELAVEETPTESRRAVLRELLTRLLNMGKIWPASADPRGLARDLREGQSGVMALERAGLLIGSQRHGPNHRVGLDKARRQEAEHLVATGETEDRQLRSWIETG
jgi:hypothetical protein